MSWYDDEATVILSGGPVRVSTSDPDPEFVPRSVGFVQCRCIKLPGEPCVHTPEEPGVEHEPQLWEGDQA